MANWLSTLTDAQREMYSAVQRGVREDLTIAAIGAAIREGGGHIANDTLREMIRRERNLVERGERLKFKRPDTEITTADLPEALTAIQRKFSFNVTVTGRLISTNAPFTRSVTVSTDRTMTRRKIEDAARKAVEGDRKRYGMEVETTEVEFGVFAGSQGVL